MVEDELFTTAQLYTRSIHRAEYERLQAEAAKKHAGKISAIHRPMDGVTRMSREVVMKHRRGMAKAAATADSSDEEGWGGGGNLAKMMGKGPAEGSNLAVRWKRARVATRAAAGFTDSQVVDRRARVKREREAAVGSQCKPEKREPVVFKKEATPSMASETDDDDGDDDLDAPVIRDISRRPINPQPRTTAAFSAPSTATIPQLPATTHPPVDARPSPYPPTNPISPAPTTSHIEPPSSSLSAQATEPSFYPDPNVFSIPKPTSTYRGRSMAARRNAEREKASQVNHEHKILDILKSSSTPS